MPYRYTTRLRPVHFSTLPIGLDYRIVEPPDYARRTHGVIETDEPIPVREMVHFDLLPRPRREAIEAGCYRTAARRAPWAAIIVRLGANSFLAFDSLADHRDWKAERAAA